MSWYIKEHLTDKVQPLVRDVTHQHPDWVHDQMGTYCEADLQASLDNYREDAYPGAGIEHRDIDGVFFVPDEDEE